LDWRSCNEREEWCCNIEGVMNWRRYVGMKEVLGGKLGEREKDYFE